MKLINYQREENIEMMNKLNVPFLFTYTIFVVSEIYFWYFKIIFAMSHEFRSGHNLSSKQIHEFDV